MFKFFKNGYEFLPNAYTHFASTVKLSNQRKIEIEERRGRLKFEPTDSKVLRIFIEEMLAYKPGLLTLDDRYLQLEQLLDAIDHARNTKNTDSLMVLYKGIVQGLEKVPGLFKNSFFERLQAIDSRLKEINTIKFNSKL